MINIYIYINTQYIYIYLHTYTLHIYIYIGTVYVQYNMYIGNMMGGMMMNPENVAWNPR